MRKTLLIPIILMFVLAFNVFGSNYINKLALEQGFEGTGTPTGYTSSTGSPNYDYTTNPYSGSESVYFSGSVDMKTGNVDITGIDNFRVELFTRSGSTNVYKYYYLYNSTTTGTTVQYLGDNAKFWINGADTGVSYSANTWYKLRIDVNTSTNICNITWLDTSNTVLANGQDSSCSFGDELRFNHWTASSTTQIDNLTFYTSDEINLTNNLTAYYSFDDSGDVGKDDSGNGFDCTLEGDAQYVSNGALNGGTAYDGTGDYCQAGAVELITDGTDKPYSLKMIVNHTGNLAHNTQAVYIDLFFNHSSVYTSLVVGVWNDSNTYKLIIPYRSASSRDGTYWVIPNWDNWYNTKNEITFTYNGGTIGTPTDYKLVINGVDESSNLLEYGGWGGVGSDTTFGSNTGAEDEAIKLDELAFYHNRELTTYEAIKFYNDGVHFNPVASAGDSTPPTYTSFSNNASSTKVNEDVLWTVTLADETALSSYIFSWNNSGSFVNDSAVSISGTSAQPNVTKTITATNTEVVCGKFYFNDSSNNWNETTNSCFTVANTQPPQVTSWNYPATNPDRDNTNKTFNWTGVTDADGETVTYYLWMDTNNPPITQLYSGTDTNYTTQLGDGDYYYIVGTYDGTDWGTNSTVRNWSIDTVDPTITWTTPNANQVYTSASTYTYDVTCNDDSDLWSANVTLAYQNGTIYYTNYTQNISSNSYNVNHLTNLLGLNQNNTISVTCTDSHTFGDDILTSTYDSEARITFNDITNSNNYWIEFAYLDAQGDPQKITQTLIDNYNFNSYLKKYRGDWEFGFVADMWSNSNVRMGFIIPNSYDNMHLVNEEIGHFVLMNKYYLDFDAKVCEYHGGYTISNCHDVNPTIHTKENLYGMLYDYDFTQWFSEGTRIAFFTQSTGALNTITETRTITQDNTAPVLSNFQFKALNSSKQQIGSDETAFNLTNLVPIEFMNISFTITDDHAISNDIAIYFNANGTNACSLGNRNDTTCYNGNNFVEFRNGTTTSTFKADGTQGDYIVCDYTANAGDTQRNYSCQIDEHYNPNVFKHYGANYNFSDIKWQTGNQQKITKNNQFLGSKKNDLIPYDADFYKLDFRVNCSTTQPVSPLSAYACDSNYTTGDVTASADCVLVAERTCSQLQDDGTKFRHLFTNNLLTGLDDLQYIVLRTEESNPNRYYAMKTIKATASGYETSWNYSTNSGSSWSNLGDGYELEMNINWFYNGTATTNVTQFVTKIESTDNLGNVDNSSLQVMTWGFGAEPNLQPLVDIIIPEQNTQYIKNVTMNWTVADPNGDSMQINITATQGNTTTNIATLLSDSTTTYNWDTRLLTDGVYNITITAFENATSDLLKGNDTHFNITIDNTREIITATNTTTFTLIEDLDDPYIKYTFTIDIMYEVYKLSNFTLKYAFSDALTNWVERTLSQDSVSLNVTTLNTSLEYVGSNRNLTAYLQNKNAGNYTEKFTYIYKMPVSNTYQQSTGATSTTTTEKIIEKETIIEKSDIVNASFFQSLLDSILNTPKTALGTQETNFEYSNFANYEIGVKTDKEWHIGKSNDVVVRLKRQNELIDADEVNIAVKDSEGQVIEFASKVQYMSKGKYLALLKLPDDTKQESYSLVVQVRKGDEIGSFATTIDALERKLTFKERFGNAVSSIKSAWKLAWDSIKQTTSEIEIFK